MDKQSPACFIRNDLGRRFLAEAIGTFIFVICAVGCLAQTVLGYLYSSKDTPPEYLTTTVGEGVGLALGMYISNGVSGGHLNPAVSFVYWILGHLTWKELLVHWMAQYFGAFAASCTVYTVYTDAQDHLLRNNETSEFDKQAIGSIYAPAAQSSITWWMGFSNVTLNSALFMLVLLAISDKRNMSGRKNHTPGLAGLVLTVIGLSFGLLCGSAINPARDLSGRVFSVLLGWDFLSKTHENKAWFWTPVVVPHLGMLVGAIVYHLFVGNHWPDDNSEGAKLMNGVDNSIHEDDLEGIVLVRNNKVEQKRTIFTEKVKIKRR